MELTTQDAGIAVAPPVKSDKERLTDVERQLKNHEDLLLRLSRDLQTAEDKIAVLERRCPEGEF